MKNTALAALVAATAITTSFATTVSAAEACYKVIRCVEIKK